MSSESPLDERGSAIVDFVLIALPLVAALNVGLFLNDVSANSFAVARLAAVEVHEATLADVQKPDAKTSETFVHCAEKKSWSGTARSCWRGFYEPTQ
jgi:hypothetical protein